MKKFDWGKFKTEKIAVHCKTYEEAKDFCQKMHEHGLKWNTGDSFLGKTKYRSFKKETCYSGTGCYCPYDYYKEEGYVILEWSDYMKKEFTKSDLKDGMIVEHRDGDRAIILDGRAIGDGFLELNYLTDDLMCDFDSENDIVKVFKSKKCDNKRNLFNDENLELIWEREEVKRMTVEEMRQKLEELTGEKIEYEPSKVEMIGMCYEFCKTQNCSDCVLSHYGGCCFKNYPDEKLKQCYEKVMEDGREE